jgi:hypothetical protein
MLISPHHECPRTNATAADANVMFGPMDQDNTRIRMGVVISIRVRHPNYPNTVIPTSLLSGWS